ncbi:MAG: hypothetical protein Q9174_004906, partial [Haloplaca sp. 1 TL-2023]
MVWLNPGGHNFVGTNTDGWGILQLVFCFIVTFAVWGLSIVLWFCRNDPVIRMRKVGLAITATNILHVYTALVLIVYAVNEYWPCRAEFWIMSLYLPIGIGLYQAYNQQLLLISRGQQHLLTQDIYKPLPAGNNTSEVYWNAFILWCKDAREQEFFEAFVAAGVGIQFIVSLVIYTISRKFNSDGLVSHATTEAMCRRGWEWAPSIIWQALWNFIAGPYLLWKIRLIRDIYNWRLQTFIAIVAGLPGTPLWLTAVYSDKLEAVNKYWNPAMWFVPGLLTIEFIMLLGPLITVYKARKNAKETSRTLKEFDDKKAKGIYAPNGSLTTSSTKTRSSRGVMFNMQSLDACLSNTNSEEFQDFHKFCSEKCFNGENVNFLDKVIKFKAEWIRVFNVPDVNVDKALVKMYRNAVDIYLKLVDDRTAQYAINVEGHIYAKLKALFGEAANEIASRRPSTPRSASSGATPWDELPTDPFNNPGNDHPLRPMLRRSIDKTNSTSELITEVDSVFDPRDQLQK